MHIEELTLHDSLHFLVAHQFGRIACVRHSQPYITPFNYAYHDHFIYSFSTVGQKIEWLRANPLACIEVDEIESPREWTSVVVSGRYEELPNTADGRMLREQAFKLLQKHTLWWEPGFVRTTLHGTARPLEPVYYRISIEEISGHRAKPI
jgi:nitroimidazol reductase NimA-like FMN-containing flavoprotein (pyridoxamine 5'-phosphate oxidase superfamily)